MIKLLKENKIICIYGIFALIIIPVFTIVLGIQADIFKVSFSEIAAGNKTWYTVFLVWTILFCVFYSASIIYILSFSKLVHTKIKVVVYIAVLIMVLGNVIPFDNMSFASEIHVLCAQIASFGLGVSIILLPFAFKYENERIFKKALSFVTVLVCVMLSLVALFGSAAITEIVGVVLTCMYLFYILYMILIPN